MKRPDGVTVIAVWYFVQAFLLLILACTLLAIPASGVIADINDPIGEFWVIFSLTCGEIFIVLTGIALVFAGWGLLRMKQWARWLAFVLGIFSLFAFPVGTVIGALIIWYLFKDEVREAFDMASSAAVVGDMPDELVEDA
ncbi:MAG: hypothetical protein JSV42_02025 [Chloroflexota bacterium]|nr:MAG: hypothetical protein JSV42_02025 [Chloroflexota bacterium]